MENRPIYSSVIACPRNHVSSCKVVVCSTRIRETLKDVTLLKHSTGSAEFVGIREDGFRTIGYALPPHSKTTRIAKFLITWGATLREGSCHNLPSGRPRGDTGIRTLVGILWGRNGPIFFYKSESSSSSNIQWQRKSVHYSIVYFSSWLPSLWV
jgi:hypothetical protein